MPGKRLDEMVEESNDTGAWYPGKLMHDAVEDMENGTYELRSRRRDPQDGERPKSSNQERGEWHRTTCRTTMASRTEGSLRGNAPFLLLALVPASFLLGPPPKTCYEKKRLFLSLAFQIVGIHSNT